MIWCVPANNKSSKWNTSDTRFVVWAHRQVSSMFGTKPHFVRICSRRSCQRLGALLRPERLLCSFQIIDPLLGSSVSGCHSCGGFAYTTSPSLICALRKAVFTSEYRVLFGSEVCCLRESRILTDAVVVVLAKASSSFTFSSKPLSTHRALCGFSTHLPLIILASASLSYTSV